MRTLSRSVRNARPCVIDKNKSITVRNLKYNCNEKQLGRLFSNLTAGAFPPNGKLLRGAVLVDGLQNQNIWNGKKIRYGASNDRGTLTNTLFGRFEKFRADIYRTKAPIDGKPAFALNYKIDTCAFLVVDYLREVQPNLYLGFMTIRPKLKFPVVYFLLENK